MKAPVLLAIALGVATGTGHVNAQQAVGSNTAAPAATSSDTHDPPDWLFPVAKLDQALPDWLRIGGQYRSRFEGPAGIGYAGVSDAYLLSRLRLRVEVQPESWLLFKTELQDARVFFNHHVTSGNPNEDTWTLWEGYAQVGNSNSGWGDVLAGRQALLFGDERVIGPSNWLNVGRTFNVARVDLHHPGYKISLFASSVVPGDNTELHSVVPGNNLYGVYGSFENLVPGATVEPYVLWRLAPGISVLSETVGHGHLNEVTYGLHWKGALANSIDYDMEFNWQTGSLGAYSIGAWAGYASIGKQFANWTWAPRVFLETNYASGTKDPTGRRWSTFDQLYPSNHDKFGFADQVGRRNLEQFRIGIEEEPTRRWKLKQTFEGYWLATSHDNLYASSGAIAVPASPGANRHIGNELDLVAEYQWSSGLSFGFGYARMFAGDFLKTTTHGHDYVYPFAYLQYNFTKSGFHFPITPNRPNF
jgi:Alginate export